MKKRISLFTVFASVLCVLAFAACSFGVTDKEYDANTPDRTGDTDSIVINEVYTDENGEQWVNISMNAKNTFIQDSRTVMPDKPKLYFSVVGSTEYTEDGTTTGWQDTEDADCTAATAAASGKLVIDPYYGTSVNQTTGITLTLKVGKSYYLTAYGTSSSPAALSEGSLSGYDCTGDSIYTDYSSTSAGLLTTIGASSSDTDVTKYYKFRETEIGYLQGDAVVRGTIHVYVGTKSTGDIVFYSANADGTADTSKEITSLSITTSSRGIGGTGQPVILIDLPITSGDSGDALTLKNSGRSIQAIEVKWTAKTSSAISGSFVYDLSDWKTSGKLVEFKPYVAVGEYDLDISFLSTTAAQANPATAGTAAIKNDVFSLHDTLIVWKNQKSKILGTSSFYSAEKTTADLARDGTSTDKTNALIDGKVQTLDSGSVYTSETNKCKAYTFTASDVVNFQRTTFYVSGSGGTLPTATGTPDGSLFNPYATVQAAVDAIAVQRAAGYDASSSAGNDSTDWNIVLDGAEATATAVSFSNIATTYTGLTLPDGQTSTATQAAAAVAKGMNLTIRAFNPANKRAALSEDFTFINANNGASDTYTSGASVPSATGVRLYLTNVDWNGGASTNKFTLGADCYLSNSSICSNITTPAAGTGSVHLNTAVTDTTGNGVFYVDAENDTTSTVMNIVVDDGNTTKSGGYGHDVLNYLYHAVNTDLTGSETTYMNVKVTNPSDAADSATRFAVQGAGEDTAAAAAAGATYYNSDSNAKNGIKKVLNIDTEVGSDTYGCIIVEVKDIAVSTPFSAGNYRGTVAMTPLTIAASTINVGADAAAQLASRTITGTLTVVTEDPDNYAADDAAVKAALGKETNGSGTMVGDGVPSNGSMMIYLAESEDANAGVNASVNSLITVNYIDDIATNADVAQTKDSPESGQGTAAYTFSVVLDPMFAYAKGTYYLRVYFEIGEDDNATPFSETFKLVIN